MDDIFQFSDAVIIKRKKKKTEYCKKCTKRHVFYINTSIPATNCDPDMITLWKHQSWQTEHTNIHVLKKNKKNETKYK